MKKPSAQRHFNGSLAADANGTGSTLAAASPEEETAEIAEGEETSTGHQETAGQAFFYHLKAGPGGMNVQTVLNEIAKLRRLRALGLPADLFTGVPPKILQRYRQRVNAEEGHELRRHPGAITTDFVSRLVSSANPGDYGRAARSAQ